jgi:hypothetical protein
METFLANRDANRACRKGGQHSFSRLLICEFPGVCKKDKLDQDSVNSNKNKYQINSNINAQNLLEAISHIMWMFARLINAADPRRN